MLRLGRVAVHRSRFPVTRSPDSARQGSRQSLGRLLGTTHGELDLLVNLAGQAPGLILRPHQVRFLPDARGRPVPSQRWCVSQCFDRAGEQQHRPIGNLHARRPRSRWPAYPAFPDGRIPLGRRGRIGAEGGECRANRIGWCLTWRVAGIRLGILGKGDTHVRLKAWRAVPDQIPPINIRPQQPSRWVRVGSGPYLRHAHQCGAAHPPGQLHFMPRSAVGCRRSPGRGVSHVSRRRTQHHASHCRIKPYIDQAARCARRGRPLRRPPALGGPGRRAPALTPSRR